MAGGARLRHALRCSTILGEDSATSPGGGDLRLAVRGDERVPASYDPSEWIGVDGAGPGWAKGSRLVSRRDGSRWSRLLDGETREHSKIITPSLFKDWRFENYI